MLHLYLDEVLKNKEEMFIYDVEGFFFTHKMKYSEIVKKAVQQIEQGQFLDLHQYQDRFGIRRSTFELSTGCKSIFCIESYPDFIINLMECGINARDFIIANCNQGSVFMPESGITFSYAYGKQTDILLEGYHFKTIKELNKYIRNNV